MFTFLKKIFTHKAFAIVASVLGFSGIGFLISNTYTPDLDNHSLIEFLYYGGYTFSIVGGVSALLSLSCIGFEKIIVLINRRGYEDIPEQVQVRFGTDSSAEASPDPDIRLSMSPSLERRYYGVEEGGDEEKTPLVRLAELVGMHPDKDALESYLKLVQDFIGEIKDDILEEEKESFLRGLPKLMPKILDMQLSDSDENLLQIANKLNQAIQDLCGTLRDSVGEYGNSMSTNAFVTRSLGLGGGGIIKKLSLSSSGSGDECVSEEGTDNPHQVIDWSSVHFSLEDTIEKSINEDTKDQIPDMGNQTPGKINEILINVGEKAKGLETDEKMDGIKIGGTYSDMSKQMPVPVLPSVTQ